ncbi:MAG: LPS assembly lipoprotein LptE [Zymomonas mobilis subsp. pomaceae]|uniref:LPS assembly lipoprotein LptE n=1 Tax=Zymomonas mobilis TaxID=542 RepID=UPI00130ECE36|nr:LPS assembly lipoprotein LptE [Zymomonas mobilis]MDX5948212.1 LPS assembly lipoprotein LptE [Zymomonas mobilis subsp. pomaceae]
MHLSKPSKIALLLFLCMPLPACGLHPLYKGGKSGPVAKMLGTIHVASIPGKSGYLLHGALQDRLLSENGMTPQYQLEVEVDDRIDGLGIRTDNTVNRERRTLRARYRLINLRNNQVVVDSTAVSDAGIDVVSSEYATIAAEDTALQQITENVANQIITHLALYAERRNQADQKVENTTVSPDKAQNEVEKPQTPSQNQ